MSAVCMDLGWWMRLFLWWWCGWKRVSVRGNGEMKKGAEGEDIFGLRLWIGAVVDACLCFAPLLPLPSPPLQLFCIVTMQHTGTHCVVVSICVFSFPLFLSPHMHTHAHTLRHETHERLCFSAAGAAADALVVVVCTALLATTLGQKEQRRLQRR